MKWYCLNLGDCSRIKIISAKHALVSTLCDCLHEKASKSTKSNGAQWCLCHEAVIRLLPVKRCGLNLARSIQQMLVMLPCTQINLTRERLVFVT